MSKVEDTNSSRLKGRKPTKTVPDAIQVNVENAPLLTTKFLELILKELKILNDRFEHIDRAAHGRS